MYLTAEFMFSEAMMVRLADDMYTIISEPKCVANGCDTAKGTEYEAHPFFEGSSIHRFGDWYYFVYSSLQGDSMKRISPATSRKQTAKMWDRL